MSPRAARVAEVAAGLLDWIEGRDGYYEALDRLLEGRGVLTAADFEEAEAGEWDEARTAAYDRVYESLFTPAVLSGR